MRVRSRLTYRSARRKGLRGLLQLPRGGVRLHAGSYEIFAGSWGSWADPSDSPIWTALNTKPKYVASTTLTEPRWANTRVLSGDLAAAIGELNAKLAGELQVHGFDVRFSLTEPETLRAKLVIDTPLGQPQIPARVEISPRGLWLPTQVTTPVVLPVHAGYEFTLPAIPARALEESLSEKLAAWRRRRKLRDLYDLNLFSRGSLNEPLIRRLLVLKVWHDVVDDGLGAKPFDPAEIVADINRAGCPRRTSAFSPSPSTR
jgi:hypothetical protein